jgi:hypothetical protein
MMQNILFIIFIACAIACNLIGRFGLENIKKYLHLIVLGFALFMLFIGIFNYQGASYSKDFIRVPGYITDVKSTRRYAGKRIRTEYSCTIHYTFTDGKDYYCEEEGLIEKPDENLSKVWVSRDNKDVHMYSSKSALTSSMHNFMLSGVLFLVTIPLFIIHKKKYPRPSAEELEDASIIGTIFAFIGVALLLNMNAVVGNFIRHEEVDYFNLDIFVVGLLIAVTSIMVVLYSKRKLKH